MGSENNTDTFSFGSFIIYFLPGTMLSLGFLVATKSYRLHNYSLSDTDWFTGLLFIFISLVVGIIFSAVSDQFIIFIYRLLRLNKPTAVFLAKELQGEFIDAFRSEFNIRLKRSTWCEEYFLLVRDLVNRCNTQGVRTSRGLEGLALLKGYLILPVIVWTANGVFFTLSNVGEPQIQLIVLLAILAGGYLLSVSLWLSMYRQTRNEVRLTMIAFVRLCKSKTTRNRDGVYY
jgi:hypothetical protein